MTTDRVGLVQSFVSFVKRIVEFKINPKHHNQADHPPLLRPFGLITVRQFGSFG